MRWISVNPDHLPKEKQRVLIYVPESNSRYNNEFVHIYTANFIKGLSKNDRELMRLGKIADPHNRRNTYSRGDEHGNNFVPYAWEGDGPMNWFGQEVSHWMPVPESP